MKINHTKLLGFIIYVLSFLLVVEITWLVLTLLPVGFVPESNIQKGWKGGGYNGWQAKNDTSIALCYNHTVRYFSENKDATDSELKKYYDDCLWYYKVWI